MRLSETVTHPYEEDAEVDTAIDQFLLDLEDLQVYYYTI